MSPKVLMLLAKRRVLRSDHERHLTRRAAGTIYHIIVNKRAEGSIPGVQAGNTAMLHSAGKLSPS
jgi:hypothetical protein